MQIIRIIFSLLVFVFTQNALAQNVSQQPDIRVEGRKLISVDDATRDLSDDFQVLVSLRKSLLSEQSTLRARSNRLNDQVRELGSIGYWQNEIAVLNERILSYEEILKSLTESENQTAEQIRTIDLNTKYISTDQRSLKTYQENIKTLTTLIANIKDNEIQLSNNNNRFDAVELKLANLFNLEKERNSFRMMTSIAFVVLVAIVIIGFYVIALKKEEIAESIFAGEKGIQFVTIFLIVISIILFGIMGVLESKELSALLGGLSGYILGRVSNNAPTATKKKPKGEVNSEV